MFDLEAHLRRQHEFSQKTFGPGQRTEGVTDHIAQELDEIRATEGYDLEEWIDVIILAFDGALRAGFLPSAIIRVLEYKQSKNESRNWPDWRTQPKDKAINHVRETDTGDPCISASEKFARTAQEAAATCVNALSDIETLLRNEIARRDQENLGNMLSEFTNEIELLNEDDERSELERYLSQVAETYGLTIYAMEPRRGS